MHGVQVCSKQAARGQADGETLLLLCVGRVSLSIGPCLGPASSGFALYICVGGGGEKRRRRREEEEEEDVAMGVQVLLEAGSVAPGRWRDSTCPLRGESLSFYQVGKLLSASSRLHCMFV